MYDNVFQQPLTLHFSHLTPIVLKMVKHMLNILHYWLQHIYVDKRRYKTIIIFSPAYLKQEKMNQVSFLPVSYNDFTFKNIKYEYFCIYTIFQTRTLKKFAN